MRVIDIIYRLLILVLLIVMLSILLMSQKSIKRILIENKDLSNKIDGIEKENDIDEKNNSNIISSDYKTTNITSDDNPLIYKKVEVSGNTGDLKDKKNALIHVCKVLYGEVNLDWIVEEDDLLAYFYDNDYTEPSLVDFRYVVRYEGDLSNGISDYYYFTVWEYFAYENEEDDRSHFDLEIVVDKTTGDLYEGKASVDDVFSGFLDSLKGASLDLDKYNFYDIVRKLKK